MEQFVLKINLGNDAMKNPGDISRALKQIAMLLEKEGETTLTITDMRCNNYKIYDVNGNKTGWFEVI